MKITTGAGPLPFTLMTFPDGQPHFTLGATHTGSYDAAIEAAIRNPNQLFNILLAKSVLDLNGFITDLKIRYLMGGRMDRRIDSTQPFTLEVVARLINGAGFRRITILDPHSIMSMGLLNAEAIMPTGIVGQVLAGYSPADTVVIIPDKGAARRVNELLAVADPGWHFTRIQCDKVRDSQTGKLSGFKVLDESLLRRFKSALIIDDLCDGGGTFSGLAEEIKLVEGDSFPVDLYVTHGIFSKDLPLDGIRRIYTTDSYNVWAAKWAEEVGVTCYPVEM